MAASETKRSPTHRGRSDALWLALRRKVAELGAGVQTLMPLAKRVFAALLAKGVVALCVWVWDHFTN